MVCTYCGSKNMIKMEYNFNHGTNRVSRALGIPDNRREELMEKLREIGDHLLAEDSKIRVSKLLERVLQEIDNPQEQIWLIYKIGNLNQPPRITMLPISFMKAT